MSWSEGSAEFGWADKQVGLRLQGKTVTLIARQGDVGWLVRLRDDALGRATYTRIADSRDEVGAKFKHKALAAAGFVVLFAALRDVMAETEAQEEGWAKL